MAAMKLFSSAIFLVTLFMICTKGYAQKSCSTKDITVKSSPTGKKVQGAPEYQVTISNGCGNCPLKDVYVSCPGFQSLEPVDKSVFRVEGGKCLINGGNPIVSAVPKTFFYAFTSQFNFVPVSSAIAC